MSNASISAFALTFVACVAPRSPTGGSDGDTISPQFNVASGYQLQSRLAVTAGAVAPSPASELLEDLESDPGATLVTIAEIAGVPAADLLFDALPSSLSSKVTGWMSKAINSSTELQTLIAWSQVVLAEVELSSSLRINALDSEQPGRANHTLDALHFEIDGRKIEQPILTIEAIPGAGHASPEIWIDQDDEGQHLVLGEHTFGLLLGEAAYHALENAVENRYGQDMRGLLGASVDCQAMAQEVAERCVLRVCVGHTTELANLCEAALDEAIDMIHDQFSAFDTEVLRLSAGSALIVGDSSTQGSLLQEGEWAASAEFGVGLRDIDGSFSGTSAR